MVDKKTAKKSTTPKSNVKIHTMNKMEKAMPENLGKGAKYAFLSSMAIGECVCIPPGEVNVDHEILKRAILGAARRFNVKVVTAVDADGFNVWRKE